MRLLYVFNNPAFFVSHRVGVAEAAQRAGFEVHVATPAGPAVDEIRRRGFHHHVWPVVRSSRRPDRELRAIASLVRIYRRVGADVIEHATIKPIIYGGIARRVMHGPRVVNWMTGLGYVFLANGARASVRRRAVRVMYRRALSAPGTRVIFENPDDLGTFVSGRLVAAGATHLVRGAGVEMDRFPYSAPPPGPPLVTLASRMLWDKGVAEFVAAARLLRAQGSDARCVLVGDPDPGNPASVPPAQLTGWHREGVVEWWGHRDDMPDVFRRSSVVCLPSYGEGLPRVLLEAAASGRPLVATDVPGCREIVRHGSTGFLVQSRSAASLAEGLARLLGDPDLRVSMGRAGRDLVAREFTLERVVRDTLRIYAA